MTPLRSPKVTKLSEHVGSQTNELQGHYRKLPETTYEGSLKYAKVCKFWEQMALGSKSRDK